MLRFKFARMPIRVIAGLSAVAIGLSGVPFAAAQEREGTSRAGSDGSNTAKPNGAKLARPEAEADALRVENPPPALLSLLNKWEVESSKVKKLQGEHLRWEYDYTFNVVKRNKGEFYYEQPDRGRIDLTPVEVKMVKDEKGKPQPPTDIKKHWKTGQDVKFTVQPGTGERWYCDGQTVTQIDEKEKTATQLVIPPNNRGERIIDGPLPFLFGMPADKALRRYRMAIIGQEKAKDGTPISVTLQIHPKLRSDAANYQLATVILDLKTYLPSAVRMIDPAGTKETTYSFQSMKANARAGILPTFLGLGEKDPFKPNLKGMKVALRNPDGERADGADDNRKITQVGGTAPAKTESKVENAARGPAIDPKQIAKPTLPSVVGSDYRKAKEALEQRGYVVKLLKGSVTENQEEINQVERQSPDAKSNLPQGSEIKLWVFLKPKVAVDE
ncbi:MAG: PASTA domain-containing protein [Planctomycetia bacterium]|nr:PASTA domain-containing protein [Planctomycetia bacterium]